MKAKVINKEHNLIAAAYNEDGSYIHYYETVNLGENLKLIFDEDLYFPIDCEIEQLIQQALDPFLNKAINQATLCCISETINQLLSRLWLDHMVFTEKEKFHLGNQYKKVWGISKYIFDKS